MSLEFFKPDKSKKLWLSSDFHAYHKNLCVGSTDWSDKNGCRPFNNEVEMTEQLVKNINSTVAQEDILIHCGDWAFGGYDNVAKFRNRINCKNIVTLIGNHDHHIQKDERCRSLFTWVGYYLEFRYKGILICMSHYPMEVWNQNGKGSIMVHGHCHHSKKDTGGRKIDVGVDGVGYDFKPLSIENVVNRMSAVPVKILDHHNSDTK